MKTRLLYFLCAFFITHATFSQDFLGISTGNYAGVTGVMLQPASIVDSRYKFDVNIFSTGINYSNNYFLLDRDAILKFNKNNFSDYQTFKARYLSEANLGAGERAFFNITNRTQLPLSFMATTGKKSAIALNLQSRSMIQGRNITRDVASMAYNGFYYAPLNNQPLDASGLSINALNWVEAGLTYGRVLYSSDKHFVKAAFTGKYLGGIASMSLGSDNFSIGVNTDSSVNIAATNFRYNHNESADFDMVFDRSFRPDASAFGFDAGLVYEYRGNLENNKYIRNDDEASYEVERRDVNKYIFKLGVSLLDMGSFTFTKPANVQSFNANITGWDVRNGNYNTIAQFDTALAARVTPVAGDPRNYNVYLPGALSVQLDIRFVKGLFLNAMAYRPLSTGGDAGTRFNNYGYYSITPRYERRHFGIYLPYSFTDRNNITNYRDNRLGATLRVGPLFIGSSNLGTMLFNDNLSAADVHLGLKIGITYGKPTKVSKLFERKNAVVMPLPAPAPMPVSTVYLKENIVDTSNLLQGRVAVDYTNGLVYGDDRKGNIIIINNNYYYGNKNPVNEDQLKQEVSRYSTDSMALKYLDDSLQQSANSASRQADSTEQVLQDSIKTKKLQLDSLINNLQLLRQSMDSGQLDGGKNQSLQAGMDTVAGSTNPGKANMVDANIMGQSNLTLNDTLAKWNSNDNRGQLDSLGAIATSELKQINSTKSIVRSVNSNNQTGDSSRTGSSITNVPAQAVRVSNQRNPDTVNVLVPADSIGLIKPAGAQKDTVVVKKKASPAKGTAANVVNAGAPYKSRSRDTVVTAIRSASSTQSPANTENELHQKYLNESARLQQEINRLRSRVDANRNVAYQQPVRYPYPIPVPVAIPVYNNPAPVMQPISIAKTSRDTIYIRDTIRVSDTLTVRDTLTTVDTVRVVTAGIAAKPKVQTIVRTDTVAGRVDYRMLPPEIILFPVGKSAVRKMYHSSLDYIAGVVKKDASLTLLITGHTDPTGPVAVNAALAVKRANEVKAYFTGKGVVANRILVSAAGSSKPAVDGSSREANTQNRRVVISIQ